VTAPEPMGLVDAELSHLDGLYVGMLTPHELAIFERACTEGRAVREWNILGLSKVRVIH
jgi:hypothetical protein